MIAKTPSSKAQRVPFEPAVNANGRSCSYSAIDGTATKNVVRSSFVIVAKGNKWQIALHHSSELVPSRHAPGIVLDRGGSARSLI